MKPRQPSEPVAPRDPDRADAGRPTPLVPRLTSTVLAIAAASAFAATATVPAFADDSATTPDRVATPSVEEPTPSATATPEPTATPAPDQPALAPPADAAPPSLPSSTTPAATTPLSPLLPAPAVGTTPTAHHAPKATTDDGPLVDPAPAPVVQATAPTLIDPTLLDALPTASFAVEDFDIPPFLLPIYQAAGSEYGIAWQVLAGINKIETDYGRNLSVSSAGALGWMQFMPGTWAQYGVDANGDGVKDPYNPADAIFTAARYLKAAGGDTDLAQAVFAYNHASWYVDEVMQNARAVAAIPDAIVAGLTGLTQGLFPLAAADTSVSYKHASSTSPTAVAARTSPAATKDSKIDPATTDAVAATTPETKLNPRPTSAVPATEITAPAGSPVVAVQDGTIEQVGHNAQLGDFVRLRDAYGNRYTYANLGQTQAMVAVPRPTSDSADTTADDESSAPEDPTGTPAAAAGSPNATTPDATSPDTTGTTSPANVAGTTPDAVPSSTPASTSPRATETPSPTPAPTPKRDASGSDRAPVDTTPDGTSPTHDPAPTTPATRLPGTSPAETPVDRAPAPTGSPAAASLDGGPQHSADVPSPASTDARTVLTVNQKTTAGRTAGRGTRKVAVGRVLAAPMGVTPDQARLLQARDADNSSTDAGVTSTANPITGPLASYFSIDYGLRRQQVMLKKLRAGQAVIAGTILGKTKLSTDGSGTSKVTFALRPAGQAHTDVDARPFLDGWKLASRTELYGAQAKAAVQDSQTAGEFTVGQILLLPKTELARRVLADHRISIYACGRQDIQTGQIDRRVLALLEVMAQQDMTPVVTALKCGHGLMTSSGNISEHSTGDAVDIGSVYGTVISPATQGPGSITDKAVRQLLKLQGIMRPHQIITLMKYDGQDNTLALPDHYNHIHVGYRPVGEAVSAPADGSALTADQWSGLVHRLGEVRSPSVQAAPSAYALATSSLRHVPPTTPKRDDDPQSRGAAAHGTTGLHALSSR